MSEYDVDRIRREANRIVARDPELVQMLLTDAETDRAVRLMIHGLEAIDLELERQGLTVENRDRVIRSAIYGTPDLDAARARIEERQRRLQEMIASWSDPRFQMISQKLLDGGYGWNPETK